ncbi:MAG: hypothetical protein LAT68_01460 [Cyclobacteriaceae bacterium]|nr:hypothetical protein [Cyclobacteriaceae bacterium]MCH8514970.1 hypothetical protein [Cyclobacteriaceae bacterium]
MNKTTLFAVLIALVAILALFFYHRLGGFNAIEVSQSNKNQPILLGQYYKGEYGDENLKKIFFDTKEWIEQHERKALLTVVYFNKPEEEDGKVDNFIGVWAEELPADYPKNWERYELQSNDFVKAEFLGHPVVYPSPTTIEEKMNQFAKEKQLVLDSISIEVYPGSNHLKVYRPILK